MKSLLLMLLLLGSGAVLANETDTKPAIKAENIEKLAKKPSIKTPVPLNYWVHFDPKTADKSLAAYAEFFNVNMDKNLYLTAVENEDFNRVELHAVDKTGKDYQPSTDLPFILPPMGGSVKLEYGGHYILLLEPKKPIVDESETTLTLHYRVEGSETEVVQQLVFPITANGIGCGEIPPSE